ncbi:MAG: plasmid pRiA4b ORF-3 family protein [Gammaproteobacteria bacterium]|nr:plasmid pRiA4b ORF-3 family protein [Gammaproteobacteria bacterium]MCP5409615.1 plasmid pRiA4b ORF-3 family protein [Chromatiaceae bacterium]MCP5441505.1 plasmid pRiA4b ORF-3 family protein [Chromatiaceae bacterium]
MQRNLRDLFQIRISLSEVEPPVWRRLLISSSTDLAELHQVIQIAMGWSNSDLHQFTADHQQFGIPDTEYGDSLTPERGKRIGSLLKHENQWITYEYDFGDSWEHKILLEKILPFQPEAAGPRCIDGRRSCPPEDVGGAWGYQEFLEAYTDSGHPDHREKVEWIGDGFDPEHFDIDEVNKKLKAMRKAVI